MISGDEIKENISKNIIKYREKAGLSQKELAKQLDITPSRISNWEQGANCPTMDILFKVCKALNVSINDIYGVYPDSEIILTYNEQEHIKKYRNLDDSGKNHIDYELNREAERVEKARQQKEYIENLRMEASAELVPFRIICYCQRLASAGSGEFLFDDIPTDVIKVKDTPEARKADFVIGVNGDSMEPDYYDGEKVFVKKTPDIEIGEIGVFVRGSDCYIKECGEGGLISRNTKYPGVEPFSDGIKVVGKVIGKAILVNK